MNSILQPFIELYNLVFYQPIFNLLMGIYAPIQNWPMAFALSIILMTVLVRALLVPVFMRQLKSTKAMQEIGPQVQELQRKYKQEPMVLQKELNALYKEKGVNPYMGCLPLLIQLPFLWSVYGSLNAILGYISAPDNASNLANINDHLYPFTKSLLGTSGIKDLLFPSHISFLGISLAHPDPTYILPVLAGLLTFIQMRMSMTKKPQQKPGAPPDPNAASMQMMQYIFPVMTLFFGLKFPAGLALYWVVTTLFTIFQQYFVNGRNWGGLLRGIPRLDPELRLAAAGVGAVAVTDTPRRNPRVVDATQSPRNAARPTPNTAAVAAKTRAIKNDAETVAMEPAVKETIAPKVSRPVTTPRPLAKASAVKLISSNGASNGQSSTNGQHSANGQSSTNGQHGANGQSNTNRPHGTSPVIAPRAAKPTIAGAGRPVTTPLKARPATNGARPNTTKSSANTRSRKGGR